MHKGRSYFFALAPYYMHCGLFFETFDIQYCVQFSRGIIRIEFSSAVIAMTDFFLANFSKKTFLNVIQELLLAIVVSIAQARKSFWKQLGI